MINYSIVTRYSKVGDKESKKMTYPTAQVTEVTDLNQFAKHISTHGSAYKRADIIAVITLAVGCLRELLLAGQKIKLGDLGNFYVSLQSKGAESAEKFNADNDITAVNVKWEPGSNFTNLLREAEFKCVATRAAQSATLRAQKAGELTVDLTPKPSESNTDPDPEENEGNEGSGSDNNGGGGSSEGGDDNAGL